MATKLLGIYLNDHLAGATMGLELVRRARASNEGTPLGEFLESLTAEIEADQATLERLMDQLGVRADRLKTAGAWAAEKVGRLKPNGQLTGYSPLSRLIELEGLYLGITGKREMWLAFERTLGASVPGFDFGELAARAARQAAAVEDHRLEAAGEALGTATG